MWLYLVPEPVLAVLVVGAFLAFGVGGLAATRRRLHKDTEAYNELVGFVYAVVGVIYAVLLALSAVSVWEDYGDAERIVANEANAVSDLYRNLDGYPQPEQTALRSYLRDYAKVVIEEEWPAMRHGRVSTASDPIVDRMVSAWVVFEPRTEGQKILHGQTLTQLDGFLDDRRDRRETITKGMKPVMWVVLLVGAVITIAFMFLFQTDRKLAHLLMTAGLSTLIGLVIYWLVTMDRPLMGHTAVPDHRFEAVLRTMDRLSGPPK